MKPRFSYLSIAALSTMTLFCACSKAPQPDASQQEAPANDAKPTEDVKPIEDVKPTEDAKPAEDATPDVLKAETRKIDIQTEKETISCEYTIFNLKDLDPIIEKSINELIDNERKSAAELIAGDDGHMTLTVKTEVVRATPDAIDFAVKLDRTIAGTAHPSGDVHTFMFDPKTAKRLSLSDLIAADDKLTLEALSQQARRDLPDVLKMVANINVSADDIALATEPKAENFSAILRTDSPSEGYRIYFAPGNVVAPYRDFIELNISK